MNSFQWCTAAAVVVALAACRSTATKAPERTCSEGQALQSGKIRGSGLPPKTLALTFDDGPGVRTEELSHYLKAQGVRAGFFVVGRNVEADAQRVAVLQTLVDDGHVIGNHTYTHPDLTTLAPAAILDEITRTDTLLEPFVSDGHFMFRPPFGAWNDAVLNALEATPMGKYVGPVDWDMGYQWGPGMAADWDCWSPTGTSVPPVVDVATCGNLYLQQIRAVSSGIVLMHDPYFINGDPKQGGTVDMVKNILPVLKAEGFSFVRIDEVPAIAAGFPPPPPVSDPVPDADVPDAAVADADVPDTSALAPASVPDGSTVAPAAPKVDAVDAAPSPITATTDLPIPVPSGDSSDPCTPSPQAHGVNR